MVSRPLLISIGLHALFAVIAMFGLPMLGRDLPEEMPIVRLEIVRTVPETNVIEGDKVSHRVEEATAATAAAAAAATSGRCQACPAASASAEAGNPGTGPGRGCRNPA